MGFKEGLFVLVFVAIAAPFAFKVTSAIPGFQDEAILAIVFLFYAVDAFMDKSSPGSSGYLPAAAVQSIVGARGVSLKSRQLSAVSKTPTTPSRYGGSTMIASSFKFRRR